MGPGKLVKEKSIRGIFTPIKNRQKSERFGFGLRASQSRSTGRMLVLCLLATLSTIVIWLLGYHAENKGLHLKFQANSIKSPRVISYLTLAENVLRHSPVICNRLI